MSKTTTNQDIHRNRKKLFAKTDAIYGTKWKSKT